MHRYRRSIIAGGVCTALLIGYAAYEGPHVQAQKADCHVHGYIQEPRVVVKCFENRWDAREIRPENLRHTPMIGEILRCRWETRMFFRFRIATKGTPVCSPHTTYYFEDEEQTKLSIK